MNPDAPNRSELLQYSLLALPLAFAGLPLYLHAPDFYARELGLSLTLMGSVLLVIRLLDAVQDPLIGFLSDRLVRKRFHTVIIGTAMLMIGMAAVFFTPPDTVSVIIWFAVSMILATTGFSIVSINLTTAGSFWQDDAHQRTRIAAWREGFTLLGLLIASVIPALLQNTMSAAASYQWLVLILAVLLIPSCVLFLRLLTTMPPPRKHPARATGPAFMRILSGDIRRFYLICFLSHLAASLPAVLVLFFVRDYLMAGQWYGLFLLLYFIAGAACIGVWVRLAAVVGKERAWFASMLLATAAFIGVLALDAGDLFAYGLICILSGVALGADLALPPSILADRVSQQSAEAEGNQFFAILALIPKCSMALVSGTALVLLGLLGFSPGESNSDQALDGLLLTYALLPCLLKICSALLLLKWIRNEEIHHAHTQGGTGNGTVDFS